MSRRPLPYVPASTCSVCGAPIDVHQAVTGGVCARRTCQVQKLRLRVHEDRRIAWKRRDVAAEWLRAMGLDADEVSWSMTPANRARLVPLAEDRRAEFVEYLERIAREAEASVDPARDGTGRRGARARGPVGRVAANGRSDAGTDPSRLGLPGPDESRALAAGCATCRGRCCRQGGTHAFLSAETLARLMADDRLDVARVVSLYTAHLGDEHLEDGCVFQGASGCRLPSELRAETCHRYFCEDLTEVRRRWRHESSADVHHFVAVEPGDTTARDACAVAAPRTC